MYEREKTVLLGVSASLINNNICRINIDNKLYVGVAHRGELSIVSPSAPEADPRHVLARIGSSSSIVATIMQASWVTVHQRVLLVLATNAGTLIYDWDGSVLLYSHLLPAPMPESHASFCRGIAALYTGYICVGMHTGEILVLGVEKSDGTIEETERFKWHSRPVTVLASHGKVLVSADDNGDIIITEDTQPGFSKMASIESFGSPVTCLTLWSGMVIAGYLSGHLRMYHLHNGRIITEVCAHVRCITGLDIAEESGLLISASEDTNIRVWKLSNDKDQPIEQKYSGRENNSAICGVAFTDSRGSGYVTAAYDRREILCYAM